MEKLFNYLLNVKKVESLKKEYYPIANKANELSKVIETMDNTAASDILAKEWDKLNNQAKTLNFQIKTLELEISAFELERAYSH